MYKYLLMQQEGLYYGKKEPTWVTNPDEAMSFMWYNPMRFYKKWQVSKKYEPVNFKRFLFLEVTITEVFTVPNDFEKEERT